MRIVTTVADQHELLGLELNSLSLEELLHRSYGKIASRKKKEFFACANPHSMVEMETDEVFKEALLEADSLVVDGVGVSIIGRLLGKSLGPRIAGGDFFYGLHAFLAARSAELGSKPRIFFFGSSEQVLQLIDQRFDRDYPDLELCGTFSPPYGDWTDQQNQQMIDAINRAKPDVLWVGMTAPKQEKWIYENYQQIDATVFGAIGAVFDFYAGTYKRAPKIYRKLGLEWAFRLVKEPRRMWRRMVISAPVFLWLVARHYLLR